MASSLRITKDGIISTNSNTFDETQTLTYNNLTVAERTSNSSYQISGILDETQTLTFNGLNVAKRIDRNGNLFVSGYLDEINVNLGGGYVGNTSLGGGGGGGVTTFATGGTVVDITGYKVHIFNSSDTFATTSSWPSGRTIDYLVVGGGGGAGGTTYGVGAGGAGGVIFQFANTAAAATNYSVTVGAGGSAITNGGNSSLIGGTISSTAIGGGAGGTNAPGNGSSGGSGGGGGLNTGGHLVGLGASGTSGQGNSGSDGYSSKQIGGGYDERPGTGGGYNGNSTGQIGGPGGNTSTIFYTTGTGSYLSDYNFWNPNTGNTLTFTVNSGLNFTTNTALDIISTDGSTPGDISMTCLVSSYSGNTLTVILISGNQNSNLNTYSHWNISYAIAGGGSTILSRINTSGGAGGYGYYPGGGINFVPVSPNSGGGGASGYFTGTPAPVSNGGSGVVMIRYAYP